MERAEAEKRDQVLRAYFNGRDWDESPEFSLARTLVCEPPAALDRFPLLFDYEWEVRKGHSQHGKGDLIFTDGEGAFAVVEVKWIDLDSTGSTARTRRTKKRKEVVEQALTYALQFYLQRTDADWVEAMICTNERGIQVVGNAATGCYERQ